MPPADPTSPVPSARGASLWPRIVLLLVLALIGAWLATRDHRASISTNVVDLIPADERDPEAHLLRSLATQRQSRVVLALLHPANDADEPPSPAAVEAFVNRLRADPAFAEVQDVDDPTDRDALGRFLFEERMRYLLPGWLAARRQAFEATGAPADTWPEWLAETTATELSRFLARPESGAYRDLVSSDPLLLLPPVAAAAGLLEGDAPADDAAPPARIWALSSAAPLDEAGQQPVADALAAALAAARAVDPSLTMEWTGVGRFAAASRAGIQQELSTLNLASILGVLVVTCLLVRAPWRVAHLLPIVGGSLVIAWAAVTLVFDRVHVLVFVLGALLAGTAVDYGFHLFAPGSDDNNDHDGDGPDSTSRHRRKVLKPLAMSCFTTVVGFSLLTFSELPLLRHIGVFVAAGLLGALGVAWLWFATPLPPLQPRAWPGLPSGPRGTVWRRTALVVAIILIAVGLPRVHWHDDIRELQLPTPELTANDDAIRARFGDTGDRTLYLTHAADLASARAALARFNTWHDATFPGASLASAGLLIPTAAAYEEQPRILAGLRYFPAVLGKHLQTEGYLPEAFSPFADVWRDAVFDDDRPSYADLIAALQPHLNGQLGLLLDTSPDGAWLISISDHAGDEAVAPPAETATLAINQLQSLNQLFTRYRSNALHLSLAGLTLLAISVLALYGWRAGRLIFLLPAGATLVAFGVLALAGTTFNLFHLLGAFLGVCLSHDYAIFLAAARQDGAPPPASIRLSALTTATSFGVLATSAIPVVAALGQIVALIVVVAFVAVELIAVAPGPGALRAAP